MKPRRVQVAVAVVAVPIGNTDLVDLTCLLPLDASPVKWEIQLDHVADSRMLPTYILI